MPRKKFHPLREQIEKDIAAKEQAANEVAAIKSEFLKLKQQQAAVDAQFEKIKEQDTWVVQVLLF